MKTRLNRHIGQAIYAIGPDKVPSSHLMLSMQAANTDVEPIEFDEYLALIGVLERAGIVNNRGHLLSLTETGLELFKVIDKRVEELARKVTAE